MNFTDRDVWFTTLERLLGNPTLGIADVVSAADYAAKSFNTQFMDTGKVSTPVLAI